MDVQLRNEEGFCWDVSTVREAMALAKEDPTIWKISFDAPNGERIRLVRDREWNDRFIYENLMDAVDEELKKAPDDTGE